MDFSIWLNFIRVGPWLYRKFYPLELKPDTKQISMTRNDWDSEEFYIFLINHTKDPLYNINITSEFPNGLDVDFLPTESDTSSAGPISMGLDFMLCGKTKIGDKVIQTVINNISPEEKKKIKVRVVVEKSENKNLDLKFKINHFERNPKPVFSKNN